MAVAEVVEVASADTVDMAVVVLGEAHVVRRIEVSAKVEMVSRRAPEMSEAAEASGLVATQEDLAAVFRDLEAEPLA